MNISLVRAVTLFILIGVGSAFIPTQGLRATRTSGISPTLIHRPTKQGAFLTPPLIQRQRRSIAIVQLQEIFGLGLPELAVILVATVVLLGPQKISEFAKDSGKLVSQIPDELKQMPAEFQKGVEEGESNFRARNAKPMQRLPEEIKSGSDADATKKENVTTD